MNLGNDKALWLLFLVPVVLAPVYAWCFWRKAQALRVLADLLPERVASLLSVNGLREDVGVAYATVRDWMGITAPIGRPERPHPTRYDRPASDHRIGRET